MNATLSAIAEREVDPRFMPPPPSAHHDHGGGLVQEVPLVSREFLLKCGTTALYLVLQELDAPERFAARSKEELADLILEKTRGAAPDQAQLLPPIISPRPVSVREKRTFRSFKRRIYQARREARRPHGSN
jgi:hypothetical protein